MNRIWILHYDTCRLVLERGIKLKEVKSHVKTEILVATKGRIVIPIAIKVGKPYSDERKLFKEILKEIQVEGGKLHNRR